MLDINKLDKKFDEILSSFTEEKIQQWMDFADEREAFDRLFNGESVHLDLENLKPRYVVAKKISAQYNQSGENNYALAA